MLNFSTYLLIGLFKTLIKMESRTILTLKDGTTFDSSIAVESFIITYPDGMSLNQTPADFCRNNPIFTNLTDRELQTLILEVQKKERYLLNKMELTND